MRVEPSWWDLCPYVNILRDMRYSLSLSLSLHTLLSPSVSPHLLLCKERNWEGDPLQEPNHAGTLISDFLPLEIWELNVCCSSHSVSGILLWQPELTRNDGMPHSSGSYFDPLPPPHSGKCLQRSFWSLSTQLLTPLTEGGVDNQMDQSMKILLGQVS